MVNLWRTISPKGTGWLAEFGAVGVPDFTNSLNNSARRMIHAPRTLYPIIPNMSMDIMESQSQKVLYGFFPKKFRFYSENEPKTVLHINFIFFGMKNQVLICGPDENDSSGPYQHHFLKKIQISKSQIPKELAPQANNEYQTSAFISIISSFVDIIYYPPLVFTVFSGSVRSRCTKGFRHFATLRCRVQGARFNAQLNERMEIVDEMNPNIGIEFCSLFPALRLHLGGDRCLQLADRSSLSFLSKIPGVLSNGPDEKYYLGPLQHHALLIRTSIQTNKLKEVFLDRLTRTLTPYKNRAVGGPGNIILKNYHGLLLRGFLFLAAKTREEEKK